MEDINSVETWKNILKAYEKSSIPFLCNASIIFSKFWDNDLYKSKIREIAKEILNENYNIGYYALFVVKFDFPKSIHHYNIRIKFLNHIINKLKNGEILFETN